MNQGNSEVVDLADTVARDPFPAWTGGDIMRVLIVLFAAMFFASIAVVAVAGGLPAFQHSTRRELVTDARVMVPAQAAAYLLTLWFIARMARRRSRTGFFQAVHWRFPAGWLKFLMAGVILSIAIQLAATKLPIPKHMPIDRFFRSATAAWMMAVFGSLLAPFCEELFFRGLLLPVLARRMGIFTGVVLTSMLFALIHASQLAHAWAPVAMLFVVGVVLALVRIRAHSLAASVLVHAGYNAALFALLYLGSDGFHNFGKLVQ